MQLEQFHYDLPQNLIAEFPNEPRDHSRLMHLSPDGSTTHRRFYELTELLNPNDLLVLNNTRVIPARLFGLDTKGKKFEVFLLKPIEEQPQHCLWECLIRPGKKIRQPHFLEFGTGLTGHVSRYSERTFSVRFPLPQSLLFSKLSSFGKMPLPPYIRRSADTGDSRNYQTVYAKQPGSVAAPTAGLHFTDALLKEIKARVAYVTLHVGYGTFAPIQAEDISNHQMHSERYWVPDATLSAIQETRSAGGRVIAVGSTSLRALESVDSFGQSGESTLFVRPGYTPKLVDSLITNFHLPKSSLFVMICALLGTERAHAVYREAIEQEYRFFSYGDAMWLENLTMPL